MSPNPNRSFRREAPDPLPRLGDRLPLGQRGLEVSPYCLGLSSAEAVLHAYARGINFFFVTVDMHWPLYDGLRSGLQTLLGRDGVKRDDIVVAAVTYVAQPEFTKSPMRELLDAIPLLQRVDVLVFGGVYAADFLPRLHTAQQRLAEKSSGISAIGASFHDRITCRNAYNSGLLDVAYMRYNAHHTGAETDLFPHMQPDRSDTLAYNFTTSWGHSPPSLIEKLELDGDYWQPSLSDQYRFVLSQPKLDGVLLSCTHPDHLDAMVEAIDEGSLDEPERDHVSGLRTLVQPFFGIP